MRADFKDGNRTCNAQVARERELEAAAQRRPVDGGDGGHREVLQLVQRAAQVEEELVDYALRHREPLLEVRARAERSGES